jgi:hypothetical protein
METAARAAVHTRALYERTWHDVEELRDKLTAMRAEVS